MLHEKKNRMRHNFFQIRLNCSYYKIRYLGILHQGNFFFLTSSDKNEQNRDKKLHLNCKRPHCHTYLYFNNFSFVLVAETKQNNFCL